MDNFQRLASNNLYKDVVNIKMRVLGRARGNVQHYWHRLKIGIRTFPKIANTHPEAILTPKRIWEISNSRMYDARN